MNITQMHNKGIINILIISLLILIPLSAHGILRIESAVATEGDPEVLGIDPGDYVTITFSEVIVTTPTIFASTGTFDIDGSKPS